MHPTLLLGMGISDLCHVGQIPHQVRDDGVEVRDDGGWGLICLILLLNGALNDMAL
jgi:hypothetical protein